MTLFRGLQRRRLALHDAATRSRRPLSTTKRNAYKRDVGRNLSANMHEKRFTSSRGSTVLPRRRSLRRRRRRARARIIIH